MFKWWQVSLLLCCYGFFKEYRPSEPFISPFLKEFKNFTDEQVTQDIYPVGIYFNLAVLIAVFLLTDFLRYKPVLIVGGLSGIATWSLLILGTTIPVMQVVEFFYAVFMASEVAYYTYIYAKVSKEHYQKVTSHTRTAFLLGKASAGLSSQLLVHFNLLDYLELNYLSICALVITTVVAILLPSVPQSTYFHRYAPPEKDQSDLKDKFENPSQSSVETEIVKSKPLSLKFSDGFRYLLLDIKDAFTNSYVLEWSVWWALATCGYLQIVTYVQMLWEEINKDVKDNLYNGLVEFAYSLLGAAAAFSVGYVRIPWQKWGELTIGILTLIQGACVFAAAHITNLIAAYALHISYGVLYQTGITIISSEVAKDIREDSYALVFGINTFLALLFQTILTAIVVSILKFDIRTQFEIYGCYQFITGGAYVLISILFLIVWRRRRLQ